MDTPEPDEAPHSQVQATGRRNRPVVIGVLAVVAILWAINRVWTDLQFYLDRMDGPNEPEAPPWWHFWKR